MSQQQLADKISDICNARHNTKKPKNIKRQTVAGWENGRPVAKLEQLTAMCEIFNCELGYILCEPGYENKTRNNADIIKETGLSPLAVANLMVAVEGHKEGPIKREAEQADHNLEVGRFCKFPLLQSILESVKNENQDVDLEKFFILLQALLEERGQKDTDGEGNRQKEKTERKHYSIWEQISVYAYDYHMHMEQQKVQPNKDKYGRTHQDYANMYIEDAKNELALFIREYLSPEDFDLDYIEKNIPPKTPSQSSYYNNYPKHDNEESN